MQRAAAVGDIVIHREGYAHAGLRCGQCQREVRLVIVQSDRARDVDRQLVVAAGDVGRECAIGGDMTRRAAVEMCDGQRGGGERDVGGAEGRFRQLQSEGQIVGAVAQGVCVQQ